jgi:hypothetical protein
MDQSWAVFIGGLGIGSTATAFIQYALTRHAKQQDLRQAELKEAFAGFMAAFAKLNENDSSRENQVNVGLWVARIQLVASQKVCASIEVVKMTKPNSPQRTEAIDQMLKEMRAELGVGRER